MSTKVPPNDLEALIRSPTSRGHIKPPNWLNKVKSMSQEYMIDRILDNLSQIISNYLLNIVQVTITNDLTTEKINQRQEYKDAIMGRKREFTFELQPQILPHFKPWVEFVPKLGGMSVTKIRFEYDAKPEIAAKLVKITILNNHLNDASIDSLNVSIEMSMNVNGQLIKLGTLNRTLPIHCPLYPKTPSALESAKQSDQAEKAPKTFCIECGNELPLNAKLCDKCGTSQS